MKKERLIEIFNSIGIIIIDDEELLINSYNLIQMVVILEEELDIEFNDDILIYGIKTMSNIIGVLNDMGIVVY